MWTLRLLHSTNTYDPCFPVIDYLGWLFYPDCRALFCQASLALMYMHLNGFLHGDIKATNCIVVHGGTLKMIDFDTCKISLAHFSNRLTRFVVVLNVALWNHDELGSLFFRTYFGRTSSEYCDKKKFGTVGYMAPEVILEQSYGRACDWWSMGVLLFKIVFGRTPFRGETDELVEVRILKVQICQFKHLDS